MRKFAAIAAVVTIGMGSLTACSSTGAYCDAVKENESVIKSDTPAADTVENFKGVRDEAPDEVKDDWTAMIDFVEKYQAAQKAADKTKAMAALSKDAEKIESSMKAISSHAKENCGVDIPVE